VFGQVIIQGLMERLGGTFSMDHDAAWRRSFGRDVPSLTAHPLRRLNLGEWPKPN
jgi:hypothetical protein